MTTLRSIAFGILLYASLILFLIVFLPIFLVSGDDFAWRMTRVWGRTGMRLQKWITGTDVIFEGLENIPAGASVIASKHESYWETMAYTAVLDRPAFILKKELMRIPLFGTYMRRLGMIPVDRTRRGATMASMMAGARKAIAEGRPIVIFPEGTRTPPGTIGEPRPGVYLIAAELGLPIVPAALNSGTFWPKKHGPYRGGTIRVRFLPPIAPGLGRPELLARVKTDIAGAAFDLLAAAHHENPKLPASPDVAAALAAGALQSRATTASSQRSVNPSAAISAKEERT
ncbi:1-acyl-sn-glycerol-3-phosphate acyltransferase [Aureimonas endophytica]|uniref:1-acyl-sn-glycerol-3-phosphate acyltransferase n=1 Tax=Aureimonas endophytica TaxID=2027858 RepID=A0A916ZTQ9_9HYPH|nr:lysophospholipid acyltransferase family protein [Aureimonas endophytica]GGE13485.1 1-acyl-sn-glycerol-3-phosphate acyltransferase [Aureimonas endophytica]